MRKHHLTLKLIANYSSHPIHKKVAYEILGLQSNAHPLEIKEAYLKLSKKFHPDVSSVMNAEDMFKKINEAYRILKKEVGEEQSSFSSGINKNAKYNFEDSVTNEDFEIYKKYATTNRENEVKSAFLNRSFGLNQQSSESREKDSEERFKKTRGNEQQSLKARMAKFLKQ
jgi:curved DNA-binding protein CbpA